ncbi:MAG TPA: DEAD/DEAH box helicase [Methanothrix sp.]|nr:DEAD/DEAH box helicase [Methanothrix sp.]HQE97750.1 DEAD/DEAH box helicase [Methanothrix sp.]HQJ79698.1 DEAD/DEAH box helicase [Methanothrix sp.]
MSFQSLNIIDPLSRAIAKEGYTKPTPIQMQAIPYLLEGKDLMGIAQTGTGKTAAFVLPILQRMAAEIKAVMPGSPRVLVLAPTRELAAQIDHSFATYGQFLRFKHTAIFGGVSQVPQVRILSRGVDILVATPGRLLDLMNQGIIKLKSVEYFVLDEMDRMLDMGFVKDMRKIVSALPQKRQSLFFSATPTRQTDEFACKLLDNAVRVDAGPQESALDRIDQSVFFVDQVNKDRLLLDLFQKSDMSRVLVFTRTKHRADKVALKLGKSNIRAAAIHGNKSQVQRTRAMQDFKSGRIRVLVATDIAARGIDVDDISHVLNYDLPNEPESYVHRIGRTARAGARGVAYSFCEADERDYLRGIERFAHIKIAAAEHQYHSEKAKNATGTAARPPAPQRSRAVLRNARPNKPGPHPIHTVRRAS